MSTSTTSTDEGGRRALPTPASAQDPAGARTWENVSAAMAALPDPGVLARLANEFVAALPAAPGAPAASASPELPAPQVEGYSLPGALSAPSPAQFVLPAGISGEPKHIGPPNSSFYFLEGLSPERPLEASSVPVAAPAGTRGESLPAPVGNPPLPPGQPVGAAGSPAQADESSGVPGSSFYFLEGKTTALTNPPAISPPSEFFSFPALPGLQSLPGTPVVPSSPPTAPPTPEDLRAPAVPVAGATALTPEVATRGSLPEKPLAPPYFYRGGEPAPQATLPSVGFELQPEFIPKLDLAPRPFDPRLIRRDFPILDEQVHGRPLVWLDNAATTQKPNAVIERLSSFYRHENSNIHRAAHTLAARATDAFESAREKTRRFLNASSPREIVFVRGTTEGINLAAKSWGHRNVEKDDEVVITWLEHHANIVPWQQLCAEKGARLRVAPVNDRGEVVLEEYEKLLNPRTRIVAFSHVSNALGTVTPAQAMIEMAHRHGALVLLDGAQSVSHMREDVQALDCDFFVFSGHKIFAPTGIGVVYGKAGLLDTMPPWQGGGNMIQDVTFEQTTYKQAPNRFEAGTASIADAVGLGAALDYVDQVGLENIARYEHELLTYATAGLAAVPGLQMIGTAREKAGVLSFVIDGVRTEDIGTALDQEGIAVRAGHHCAQPILRRLGVESTVRASLALYNTCEDIDALIAALLRIQAGRAHRGL